MCFVRNTVKADGFAYVSRYAKEEGKAYFGIAHRKNSVLGNPINVSVFNTEYLLSAEDKSLFRERLGMHGFEGRCLNVSLDEPRMLWASSYGSDCLWYSGSLCRYFWPARNLEGICPRSSPPDHVDDYLSVLDAALRGEQKLDEEKVQAFLALFSMNAIAECLTAFFYSLLDR